MTSKLRGTARSILSMPEKEGEILRTQLLGRLNRLGILPDTAALDNVLDLTIEDILERRLQSLVFQKQLARSIHQARQLITHGHVAINEKRVTSPSYLVLRNEEAHISYTPNSPVANSDHPLHHTLDILPKSEPSSESGKENDTRE